MNNQPPLMIYLTTRHISNVTKEPKRVGINVSCIVAIEQMRWEVWVSQDEPGWQDGTAITLMPAEQVEVREDINTIENMIEKIKRDWDYGRQN